MSGGFVCAYSSRRARIMGKSPTSTSDMPIGDLRRHAISGRHADDRCLSRAERLEIISAVAAVGMGECSAWIIPMLEHGGPDEGPRMEGKKC